MQNEVKSESQNEVKDSTIKRRKARVALVSSEIPKLETPFSVQSVITKIHQAQLLRAKEDTNMQLTGIMDNVHRIITRYALDLNAPSARKSSIKEYNKKRRDMLLEKIAAYTKDIDVRQKTLASVLAWLEEWNALLSEITSVDLDEHHHWIAQMEMLPETFKAIENNVTILCKISTSLIEERKRQKKKILIRGTLWKPWKEKVVKRPATAHALRPDQMISDELATNTKVSEIQDMLQELIGTAMFSKLENNAIKYISSTIINLSKALGMLNNELKVINFQSANMYIDETKEAENELSLKIMQDLSEQNEMLQQKLKEAEEKCDLLIRFKLVTGHQIYAAFPTSSTLKVLPGLSPQSSIGKAGETEDSIDSILNKEFENIIDESQRKGTKGTGIKWDTAMSYTALDEMTAGVTEFLPEETQKRPPEDNVALKKDIYQKDGTSQHRSQKRRHTKVSHPRENSETSLSKGEEKGLEVKSSQYSDLQALEKKRKRKAVSEVKSKSSAESKSQYFSSTETKTQGVSVTSSMWEKLKKTKPQYSLEKGPSQSEIKTETIIESMDKVEMKGKKPQILPESATSKEGKIEEKEMLTKQAQPYQLGKSQSRITKEVLGSTDGKIEQSNLESFQKAILAFLKEKTDNIGKPSDKQRVLKEEELLKRTEVEKLRLVKAKMEEYFQKVAETVTTTLRKYKDIKKEGLQKQVVSFMPGLHYQKSSISSFLLNESTDPVTNNLIQMILDEIESERDVPTVSTVNKDHKEKEKKKQEEYLQEGQEKMSGMSPKHKMLGKKSLWKEIIEVRKKNLEEERGLLQTKKQEQQKQKQWQEEELWKEQQKQVIQKQMEQDEKQKQRGSMKEEQEKPKQQQLEEWQQTMEEQGVPLQKTKREKTRQVQEEARHLELGVRDEDDKEMQKLRKGIEDVQRSSKVKHHMKIKEKKQEDLTEIVTRSPMSLSPRWKKLLKDVPQSHPGKQIQRNLKTLGTLPDGKHPTPVTPPTSAQSSSPGALPPSAEPLTMGTTLTPEQAQAPGVTLPHQRVQTMGGTSAPKVMRASLTLEHTSKLQTPFTLEQAQELGTTLTLEQAQSLRVPITLQQAEMPKETLMSEKTRAIQIPTTTKQAEIFGIPFTQGKTQDQEITLTPQQAQALVITLTPQQAQKQGINLIPQQAQALGITLTPQQAQEQGITLTPQQAQALGITLTPQQAQEQGITLTPQQAQALGIILTPQQAQALGITLTPQQAREQGITLTPQQAQALGITLTPQQAQKQGITLIPQQAQALGSTLTPQQAQEQRITLTPQQAQALVSTLTPQQAQEQGITLTPQQTQEQGITLTPQQAQALGITLTPQQAQALGITLTPQQAQEQGITLTPQQAQALGITLTPQQTQGLGSTLTPQQAQEQGITLTPQQAQVLGSTLTPQQAQALGSTFTPRQAQEQGVTLTPQQAQALGITLTPQQTQEQGVTLTPQQAQEQGITLTPQQAQEQRVTLTPQQAQALGSTLTPQQAQEQGITLTPQQAQALGSTLTPQLAQEQGITLTPQQAQEQGITLTPQQTQEQGITLTPQQAQALGSTLTPQQAQEQGITLTPQQAQALGITLTPQQAQALGITLTPQQTQEQRITLTPQQAQEQGITLTPQQAQALGITLTPQQAQALGVTLTPQQAQEQGITLTPQQAQALGITLTPQQAQALGSTFTPRQAQEQGVTLTPQQAQALGITLTPPQAQEQGVTRTPQQAQALGITLTPQQAQALGITLTPQQAQALGITLTPQQAQALGITLTPQQAQALGITLTPQQAQEQGITLTPQQAQALGITLTPQQAQEQGVTLTPQQAQALGITLTPQQAQALGITLTSQQAQAQDITLPPEKSQVSSVTLTHEHAQALMTPIGLEQVQTLKTSVPSEQTQAMQIPLNTGQAQMFGVPLSQRQAEALGVTLTPEQSQAFGATLPPEQIQALWPPLTSAQAQSSRISLTPGQVQSLQNRLASERAQALMFTLTPEKAQALGITLTREQAQAAAITLTPEQAQAPLSEEQTWKLGVSITPEKIQEASNIITLPQLEALGVISSQQQPQTFHTPLTLEKPTILAPFTLRPFQELKGLTTRQSIISRLSPSLRQSPTSSISEKSSVFGVSSIPLQKSKTSLTQAPFAPGEHLGMNIPSDSGKLLAPQILPTSRQIPVYRGPAIPAQSLSPEVSPILRQLPISWAPPTPGQPLSSRQFFIPRSSLTPQPPLISEVPLTPSPPLISRVPPTSRQIPRLLAPLPPGQPLVPGASSIPRELLQSEQPQAFQTPVAHEQSIYLQTPSTLGQHLAPWILPGKASPLRISPTPGHPSTLWALPIPGKPQRVFSSSVPQKRLVIIPSLKPKSALAHPSAPDLKVSQAPFSTKKVERPEVSATSEETQMFRDTFAMEPFETFQPYLTNYRTPVSQTPYIDKIALPILKKPITSLPSLITQLPKTSQISPSEWDQKPRLPAIDKPWILTSVVGTKKPKMTVPPSSPQELEAKRYFVDVEAQRKNLILLNQATKTSGLPSQQHTIARNLITETLHMDTVRLGYLFHKYIAYRLIQHVRNNIIKRLKAIQNTGKGYETQNLYIMLSRIDDYQKKVMQVWTEKQKSLEQKRSQCLKKMIYLFSQFHEKYKLNLSQPIPLITDNKEMPAPAFTEFVQRPFLELLIEEDKKSDILKKFRQQDQMEDIWNADLSTSSYPITEKTSVCSLWAQLGGYPDIPRLLQLDIQSTFRKSLASIHLQSKKIPK